jgi:hypothetical protein
MIRTVWTAGILALLAGSSPAFGQYGAYGGFGGAGPAHALARCDAKGKVQVRQIFVHMVPTTETRTRKDKDGKDVEYKVTVFKSVAKEHVRDLDAKDIKVLGGTGKAIDANKLPALLTKETAVLVTQPNHKVDPLYFKILKKDALILVLPNEIFRPKAREGLKEGVKKEGPREGAKEPDPKADLPKGQQPQLGQATLSGKNFRLRQRYEFSYPERRTRKVEKERKPVFEEFVIQNSSVTVTTKELDAKYVQVFGTDGKEIAVKDLAERLEKETPVLVAADGQKVDPYYLRVFKKDTLIVALPQFVFGRYNGEVPKPKG